MGAIDYTTNETNTLLKKVEDEGGITDTVNIYGTNAAGDTVLLYALTFTEGRLTTFL